MKLKNNLTKKCKIIAKSLNINYYISLGVSISIFGTIAFAAPIDNSFLNSSQNAQVKIITADELEYENFQKVLEMKDVSDVADKNEEAISFFKNERAKQKELETAKRDILDDISYIDEIPMPMEHQKYLYDLCEERGLDYLMTLSVLKHESQFDASAIGNGSDYGYMQVNKVNHKMLSSKLNTKNSPLDPYINMNWGTYILADAYNHWKEQGKQGKELDEYALSTYNKGLSGFKKNGKASNYISKVFDEYNYLKTLVNN